MPANQLVKTILGAAVAAGLGLGAVGCNSDNPFPGQGITQEYRSYIPDSARKVADGTGSISYTAEQQGTIYLVDTNRREQTTEKTAVPFVVGSYLLLPGQTVRVNGGEGKVTVSGVSNVTPTTFTPKNLAADGGYQLFFDPKVEKK